MRLLPTLLFSIMLIVLSCKSSKELSNNTNQDINTILLSQLINSTATKTWFSAKAKVRIKTSEINGGGNLNIRIKRDSLIWFNFKKLSVEGIRGQITPKEFTLIYRQEKKYDQGALKLLLDHYGLPLDYVDLQSYLMGSLPYINPAKMRYRQEKKYHYLSGSSGKYKMSFTYNQELELKGFSLVDNQNRKLSVEVDNKDETYGIYLDRKMFFTNDSGQVGVLEINLSNIEFDIPKNIPFSIPSSYKPL